MSSNRETNILFHGASRNAILQRIALTTIRMDRFQLFDRFKNSDERAQRNGLYKLLKNIDKEFTPNQNAGARINDFFAFIDEARKETYTRPHGVELRYLEAWEHDFGIQLGDEVNEEGKKLCERYGKAFGIVQTFFKDVAIFDSFITKKEVEERNVDDCRRALSKYKSENNQTSRLMGVLDHFRADMGAVSTSTAAAVMTAVTPWVAPSCLEECRRDVEEATKFEQLFAGPMTELEQISSDGLPEDIKAYEDAVAKQLKLWNREVFAVCEGSKLLQELDADEKNVALQLKDELLREQPYDIARLKEEKEQALKDKDDALEENARLKKQILELKAREENAKVESMKELFVSAMQEMKEKSKDLQDCQDKWEKAIK